MTVFFETADDDEQADEHDQQGPIDLKIDFFGSDTAGEQKEGATDNGDLCYRDAKKEQHNHHRDDQQRLDHQWPMIAYRPLDRSQDVAREELGPIDQRDQRRRQDKAEDRDRRKRRTKCQVWNSRQATDDDVLRVAGDCGDAVDIGGHGDCQKIGNRIAFGSFDDVEHQRRHYQTDRVIDQKSRQQPGRQHDGHQQARRMLHTGHGPAIHQPEETRDAQIGDDDHHTEQQRDGIEVDGAISVFERQHAGGDHEAAAEPRRSQRRSPPR